MPKPPPNRISKGSATSGFGRTLEDLSLRATGWAGSSWAFGIACFVILAWGVTGPIFHYSDTWQLVINTGTTIVTFLMVFLIQRAQNKESTAVQLKLNEIVAAVQGASNRLIDVENLSEDEIATLQKHFSRISERAPQTSICVARGAERRLGPERTRGFSWRTTSSSRAAW